MPTLDGSDDGEFYTEPDSFYDSKWPRYPAIKKEDYNFQDLDSRWQDSRDTFGGETDAYPTPWAPIKDVYGIEYRHVTLDSYQLRSPTHIVTVNQETFLDYIRNSTNMTFEQWCNELRETEY